jgi:hypothetical protein
MRRPDDAVEAACGHAGSTLSAAVKAATRGLHLFYNLFECA